MSGAMKLPGLLSGVRGKRIEIGIVAAEVAVGGNNECRSRQRGSDQSIRRRGRM